MSAVKKAKQAIVRIIGKMRFDERGRELPSNIPVEIPAGHRKPESLQDTIRRLIRTDVSALAASNGDESFEEANDFELGDDDAELSPTHHELHEEVVSEVVRVRQEARDADSGRSVSSSRGKSGADREDEEVQEAPAGVAARDRVSRRNEKVKRARRSSASSRNEDAQEPEGDAEDD